MKDFEKQNTDSSLDAAPGIVTSKKRAPSSEHAASGGNAEAGVLNLPQLSHPANAAPLADLMGQLQQTHGNTYVQRVVAEMDISKLGAESQRGNQTQGLEAGAKSEMESAFSESFADVRVHADDAAEKMNEELGARAVTHGRDIYFGTGEYNPATSEGKRLLAHELTHVIQQEGGTTRDQRHSIGAVGDQFEREADRTAALIARGEHVHVEKQGAAAPTCQLDQRGAQAAPPQPTPPADSTASVTVDVTAAPSGRLPNGVIYTYHDSTGEDGVNYFWEFAMPAGMTLHVATQDTRGWLLTNDGTKKVVWVQAMPGHNPHVEITFTEGKKTTVVSFVLPRRAAALPQPHRP
jgi:hypothetical protein